MTLLKKELKQFLAVQGAALSGIADMRDISGCAYPTGISVAVPVPAHIVEDLKNAPTKEYYDMYDRLNSDLNHIVPAGEARLKKHGFQALAQTTAVVQVDEQRISKVPHKTVATRAGLGWIGKNCLLVTPQYGCAIRLSSILTDAPFPRDTPYLRSNCGACRLCQKACPAQAIQGTLWSVEIERNKILDPELCYKKQVEIMKKSTGMEQDLCGKCFAVCAYTQKYLNATKKLS